MENKITTARGVEVEFVGIATLLDKLDAAHKMPQPPTYAVKTALGATETHAHDETTLETEEDKTAWAKYQADLTAAHEKYNRDFMRVILMRGIKVEFPTDEAWVREFELMGFDVPSDPLERKIFWLESEVVGNTTDAKAIITGVMVASGMDEEVIRDAEKSFRGDVERDASGKVDGAPASGEAQLENSGSAL